MSSLNSASMVVYYFIESAVSAFKMSDNVLLIKKYRLCILFVDRGFFTKKAITIDL